MAQIAKITGKDALSGKPTLPIWVFQYILAYRRLSNSRPILLNGLKGPVPVSEVKAYCEMFYLPDEEIFLRLVMALDEVLMERSSGRTQHPRRKN
jgi:hypothetical protein